MDLNQFQLSLLHELSNLSFVKNIDFETEIFIFKGRAFLENNLLLQIYFNEKTETTAFALIKDNKRIWGIDFDNIRGWHLHPIEDPESHINTDSKNVEQIIEIFKLVWKNLIQET